MTDKPAVVSQCGACFGTRIDVIEESFAVDDQAFERFADLFRQGRSPQLCQVGGDTYRVCHLAPRAAARTD